MVVSGCQDEKKELLKILKQKAFFRQKVVLSSGKESDYYIDARRVTLTSQGAYLSAKVILDLLKNEKFSAIGGPTLGADPIIGAIGALFYQAGKSVNTFIIRKEPKKHGKQQQIEGPEIPSASEVIVIDDVATSGKAFLHSIDVLAKLNIKVKKCVCLVDRQEGAKEKIAEKGSELLSVFTIEEFLK